MIESTPSLIELTKALIEFHKALPKIHENATGQFQQNFADLSTIHSVVNPVLGQKGLAAPQLFETDGENEFLVTVLTHTSGERLVSRTKIIQSGNKGNPTHQWGAASTYQRRYALLNILGISPGIEDNDASDLGSDQIPDYPIHKASDWMKKEVNPVISKPIDNTPTQKQDTTTKRTPPANTSDRDSLHDQINQTYKENPERIKRFNTDFRQKFPNASGNLPNVIQEQEHVDWSINWLSQNS
jgi:hypothetical protein